MPEYAAKYKRGHKMEEQCTGQYTIEEVDLHEGTCRLHGKRARN